MLLCSCCVCIWSHVSISTFPAVPVRSHLLCVGMRVCMHRVLLFQNLVTVWSAPNYCYRCGNVASILAFDDKLHREFRMFKEVQDPEAGHRRQNSANYFL